ncbi:hypothetical protein ACE6H2_007614 [Prunus campanulata]
MEVDRDLIDYDYIDYIKKQWSDNNLKYIVMGSCISFYNFRVDYASGKQHYDGELFLEENKQGGIPVTFMNMDAARTKLSVPKIFRLNIRVCNKRILHPWMYTFCKQKKSFGASEAEKNMVKGWWSLCYDKFDNTLAEWLIKLHNNQIRDREKFNVKAANNCLSDFWQSTIQELIEAIVHIHDCGLFHGSLNVYDNYVVVGDQLKLFNISGRLESLRVQDQHSRKIQDFQEFRDTLKILMRTKITWLERDGFFKCFDEKFDSYEKYVEKLKNHPFLLSPLERLKYITSIYYDDKFGVEKKLNEDTKFSKFVDWPRYRHKFEPFLLKVLETRNGKPYGDSPSELLRFLRNTYIHYRQYSKKAEDIQNVDTAFRTCWVGFFDMVHLIK